MGRIVAPFTDEQVKHLNEYQTCGLHEFTCGGDHRGDKRLIATTEGWVCVNPDCSYTQNWAHESMADGSAAAAFREWVDQIGKPTATADTGPIY